MTAQKLYDILERGIRDGSITGMLPSMSAMKTLYGTSHNTIHRAVDKLKMKGLAYGQHGKGVFVMPEVPVERPKIVLVYLGLDNAVLIPFYARFLNILKDLLSDAGFAMHLASVLHGGLTQYSAAVVIGANLIPGKELERLRYALSGHVLLVNHKMSGFISVYNDNLAGGYMAIRRLYEAGHRNVAVLTKFLELPFNFFHDRYKGTVDFAEEHKDLKLTYFSLTEKEHEKASCRKLVQDILEKYPEITGIFAFSDIHAFEVIQVLSQEGKTLSVIGYDNADFSSLLSPALTTIEEDVAGLSRAVCRVVSSFVTGEDVTDFALSPRLIERNSITHIYKK